MVQYCHNIATESLHYSMFHVEWINNAYGYSIHIQVYPFTSMCITAIHTWIVGYYVQFQYPILPGWRRACIDTMYPRIPMYIRCITAVQKWIVPLTYLSTWGRACMRYMHVYHANTLYPCTYIVMYHLCAMYMHCIDVHVHSCIPYMYSCTYMYMYMDISAMFSTILWQYSTEHVIHVHGYTSHVQYYTLTVQYWTCHTCAWIYQPCSVLYSDSTVLNMAWIYQPCSVLYSDCIVLNMAYMDILVLLWYTGIHECIYN